MAPYIFGIREKIHIINLEHIFELMQEALKVAYNISSDGGCKLFVRTKRQSSYHITVAACKMRSILHKSFLVWRNAEELKDNFSVGKKIGELGKEITKF